MLNVYQFEEGFGGRFIPGIPSDDGKKLIFKKGIPFEPIPFDPASPPEIKGGYLRFALWDQVNKQLKAGYKSGDFRLIQILNAKVIWNKESNVRPIRYARISDNFSHYFLFAKTGEMLRIATPKTSLRDFFIP